MRINLVLGSGGARGNAHVGVIRELEKRGHEIVSVTGTSMGAVIGGIFASGKLDEYEEFACGLNRAEVMWLSDISITGPGLIKADRVVAKLKEITGAPLIEDLKVPFAAVATDLEARREVWFRKGPLVPAMRASFAIPSVFTPVIMENRTLVDGGVLNPLPFDPVFTQDADVTVAVSLFGHRKNLHEHQLEKEEKALPVRGFQVLPSIAEFFSAPTQAMAGYAGRSISSITTHALDTMQGAIETYRVAATPPDVLIQVDNDVCQVYDFHLAKSVIENGRELAVEQFDRFGL